MSRARLVITAVVVEGRGVREVARATRVVVLVHDLDVRVVDAATGELIRALTIDPTKDYQPVAAHPDPRPRKPR